jgi:diguanylate cyclase (GGDEF)-like protein/PAS domain S-box-containing protein
VDAAANGGSGLDLGATLDLVANSIVDSLGFGAAVVNLVNGDGTVVVAAVAGPAATRELLLGQREARSSWERLLDASEAWGRLRFLNHTTNAYATSDMTLWVPDLPVTDDPAAWHPEDALFAPLRSADGELVGILSVDMPRGGRRPDAATRLALEAFAVTASLAIQHATMHADSVRSERQFRAVFDSSPVAIALLDDDRRLVSVNPSYCLLLARPATELIGHDPVEFTHPDDVALVSAVIVPDEPAHETVVEKRYLRPDGSTVWGRLHVAEMGTGERGHVLAQVEDITEHRRSREELRRMALNDGLTGLPNRSLLLDRLYVALARQAREPGHVAALFCDLDGFKDVNDTLGHAAGDAVLRDVAVRLVGAVRPGDTVARLGGDEFVVLCGDSTTDRAQAVAARIHESMAEPFRYLDRPLYLGVSIGIAMSGDATDAETLLHEADGAMYVAKSRGRGRTEVYDHTLAHAASGRLALYSDLREALDRDELELHYQPKVDLRTGRPTGMEALLRWRHATRGAVEPALFVAVAEETGLMNRLGGWVLREACRQAAAWQHGDVTRGLPVSVNVSAQQLEFGLVALVGGVLADTGLAPSLLVLELTETAVMTDPAAALETLRRLRALGVRISVDDFGTGYSSLTYLQRFPIDELKIDRSFVSRLGVDETDARIVAHVVNLAGALGVEVVAEGVETAAQRAILGDLGCDVGQGFLWSPAVPARDLPGTLASLAGAGAVPAPRSRIECRAAMG